MNKSKWSERQESTWKTKVGLAEMLKGGVIMDVVTPEHAKIAEDSGAAAVMALERVPADIRVAGGVASASDRPADGHRRQSRHDERDHQQSRTHLHVATLPVLLGRCPAAG